MTGLPIFIPHSSFFLVNDYGLLCSQIGGSALIEAAAGGHLAVVMSLAELGVDLAAADKVRAANSSFVCKVFSIV